MGKGRRKGVKGKGGEECVMGGKEKVRVDERGGGKGKGGEECDEREER